MQAAKPKLGGTLYAIVMHQTSIVTLLGGCPAMMLGVLKATGFTFTDADDAVAGPRWQAVGKCVNSPFLGGQDPMRSTGGSTGRLMPPAVNPAVSMQVLWVEWHWHGP